MSSKSRVEDFPDAATSVTRQWNANIFIVNPTSQSGTVLYLRKRLAMNYVERRVLHNISNIRLVRRQLLVEEMYG